MIIARNLIFIVANLVIWGEWCSKYCIVSLFVMPLCSFTLAFVVSICDIQQKSGWLYNGSKLIESKELVW